MVWIGPSFVHGSDVSRLYVDGIFSYASGLSFMPILVQVGPWCEWEHFSSTSQAFYGVWLVKHFLGAIFFYLASVILRVRWIDSVAVGCFEWLSDAAEAGDVVVSMAVNVFHG